MTIHQIHFGRKFIRKPSGYWQATDTSNIRAHRWVWMHHHGEIPKGYHIHHRDGNKSNNCIENLEIMKHSDHARLHMQDPERKKMAAKCGRIVLKKWQNSEEGKLWHKSEAGQKLHKENGRITAMGVKPTLVNCKNCNKEVISRALRGREFCCKVCHNIWRIRNGHDGFEKKCEYCSKPFMCSKWINTKCCSPSCAVKKRWESGNFRRKSNKKKAHTQLLLTL